VLGTLAIPASAQVPAGILGFETLPDGSQTLDD